MDIRRKWGAMEDERLSQFADPTHLGTHQRCQVRNHSR
ncbi:MAG: hypothetical protein JWM75_1324 [Sphingomonas bacterium]|nr:hypothetical protein [Sphingomonas bacterium]